MIIISSDTDLVEIIHESIQNFCPIYIDEDGYKELLQKCISYPYLASQEGICILIKKQTRKKGASEGYNYILQPISSFVVIKHRLHNLDTEEFRLVLEINNGVKNVEKVFERTVLSKTEIKCLLSFGVKFMESYSDKLIEFLFMTESRSDIVNFHTSIGWGKIDKTPIFKCSNIFLPQKSNIKLQSIYKGNLEIEPKGSLDTWLSMLQSEVIGNIPLTVCVLLGFASPLLAYVTEKFGLGSLVFSICNESSKGKSTTGALISSIFSSPILNHGTNRSFNATQNFIVSFLAQTSGLPVIYDESAAYAGGDLESLLYLLSAGCEKNRLDSGSKLREEKSWRSIIVSTSETGLLSDDTSPNGLKARCFKITDQLTRDALNSDNIKTTIASNYGVAGEAYIQWLLDNKVDRIEDDYIEAKNTLLHAFSSSGRKPSSLTQRILSKLAVVLLAAHYTADCFNLDIEIPKVEQYLLNMEKGISQKSDYAHNALDIVLQEVSKNSARYLTADKSWGENIVGRINEDETSKTISILKREFQTYCKRNNIQNPHQILTKLKDEGILQCEPDRLTMRVRLSEEIPVQTCYVLRISDEKSLRTGIETARLKSNSIIPSSNINDGDINF